MNKADIQKELAIPKRTLERLVGNCDRAGLLESARYGTGNQREFSKRDLAAMKKYKASRENGAARREPGADDSTVDFPEHGLSIDRSMLPLTVNGETLTAPRRAAPNGLMLPPSSIENVLARLSKLIAAELATDELLRLRDLPIPRRRAVAAIKRGALKAVFNHPDVGRGYRIKKSDWQQFLKTI